ncbi:putative E3 ubiquitin-protein ligase HIP1, partial [Mucuna pruriens]
MDEYSGKRAIDGVVVPRKGMGHVFRDTANARDRNGQVCSRLTCSSRVNSPKGAQIGSSEKGKSLKPSIQSSSAGKEAIGSSSRTFSKASSPGKPLIKPRRSSSSQLETDSSETSSVQDESEVPKLASSREKIQTGLQAEVENTVSGNVMMEVGSSSVGSNTRSRRNFHPKPGLPGQEIKSTGPVARAGTSRYGLRNLRCNSVSDVVPAGCSPSDSTLNRRKDMIKKRNCEGEGSSTARGKKMSGSSLEGRNSGPRNGISISDSRISRNTPRRDRSDSNMAPARTRKSIGGHVRGRPSSQGNANPVSPNESLVMIPSLPHSGGLNAPGAAHHTSDSPLSCPSSHNRPGIGSEELYGVMPVSPSEYGITHSLMNLDSFRRRYNMDSIAEVLLALERIEQDVELTHEQIRLLESNLFLTGLNFYDPHREMRLDIDNMSYEQLLALEERMGTVSTALTEEAVSECLKKSFYQSSPSDNAAESCNEDKDDSDTKCSICQEEYVVADEVGSLLCEHMYHAVCIQQWLRLKNWCPICKASVALSNSSPSQ